MILFIGKEQHTFPIREATGDKECVDVFDTIDINKIMEMGSRKQYSHIVINVAAMINEADEITESILKLREITNSEIVIYARGYSPQTVIIQSLYLAGLRNFVLENTLTQEKEELKKCLSGYYDENPIWFEDEYEKKIPDNSNIKEEKDSGKSELKSESKTIGISGCCHRIGTTTQALQICKYLITKGCKVCYIEMNESKFVQNLSETREETDYEQDDEIGFIRYRGIDMFYIPEHLPQIKKLEYEYFVYDFGCYSDKAFNKYNFLDKDINLFVCGIKPQEYRGTIRVLDETMERKDCFYVFSFIDKERNPQTATETLFFMEEKADKTVFAPFACDPFQYNMKSSSIYDLVLGLAEQKADTAEAVTVKKKRKLFCGSAHRIKKIGHTALFFLQLAIIFLVICFMVFIFYRGSQTGFSIHNLKAYAMEFFRILNVYE